MSEQTGRRRLSSCLAVEVLHQALGIIDASMLAAVIGATPARLIEWADEVIPMTFTERLAVAMSIIALAPMGSDLFRHAARLRLQLAASVEMDVGVTLATAEPPRISLS